MANERVERRLTAILAADVAGYSRLMSADEEGTLAQLKACRRELIDPKIAEHRGRIVKTTGDGMLVEFPSVVDSVRCAIDVQRGMADRNADVPPDKRIEFRVGINVGDIMIDGDDIFGDGVNIAARLEGKAEPGGICVSDDAHRQVQGKIDASFADMGELTLKNIARPVRAFRINANAPGPVVRATTPIYNIPSLAVLPFVVMQGNSSDEGFADGLTEDIITALSRVSLISVIARNSSFAYKGRNVELRQVGSQLGARYILEGSVRRSGDRLRITAQLIESATGGHVWAEKFDHTATDLFAVQDMVSQNVAAAIQTSVRQYEGTYSERSKDVSTVDDLINLAWKGLYKLTKSGFSEGRIFVDQAFAISEKSAKLNQIAAAIDFHEFYLGCSTDRNQLSRGLSFAEKAVSLDPNDEFSLWILGILSAFLGQYDRGIGALRRATELNPSFGLGHGSLGTVLAYAGAADESIRENDISLQLNPRDPSAFFRHAGLAVAHFTAGRYADSAKWATRVAAEKSDWRVGHVFLIASLAHQGLGVDAADALVSYLTHFPNSHISDVSWIPFKFPTHRQSLVEGLRKAGLPD